MNKIQKVKLGISKITKRTGLKIKHRSPEILLVGGVGLIGVGTVLACKATLKLDDILTETQEKLGQVSDVLENKPVEVIYTEKDAAKDRTIIYTQSGMKMVRLYAPAVATIGLGIGAVVKSHKILKSRNLAIVAAYKALQDTYDNYRRRVVDEFGAEKDHEYRYGLVKETKKVSVVDEETGKKKKIDQVSYGLDPNHYSQYARFYDEKAKNWSPEPEYNLVFLQATQNFHNDLLKARGHVFLNEVYDALGIPRSIEGSIVGWVLGPDNDNYIDFGMFDPNKPDSIDFINGYNKAIPLDFNVDGIIYDLI